MLRLVIASLILAVSSTSTFAQTEKKAEAAKTETLKGDLVKIQGKWTAKVGPEKDIPLTIEFKDNKATILVTFNGQENKLKTEIKIDETKTPKEWDWTKLEGEDGQNLGENLAIYKIEGDKLTINSGGPGNKRPTEFKPTEDEGANLVEFTKVKDEPKKEEKKEEANKHGK